MNASFAFLGLGGMETIVIFGVILLLFATRKLRDFSRWEGSGDESGKTLETKRHAGLIHEALTVSNQTVEFVESIDLREEPNMKRNWKLWIAQGFGSGLIPFGPGTFGSIVGLLWCLVLLLIGSPIVFAIGIILSIPFSVWICGEAEKIMGETDPGSVVIDEIIAIPICFVSWLMTLHFTKGVWPSVEYVFIDKWPMVVLIFVLFRIFDIAKPWPVRQSQNLPGGWGVTVDDVLAAVYVNIVLIMVYFVKPELL